MSHTIFSPGDEVVLELGYASPPLTLNQRLHRMQEAQLVREVRARAAVLARQVGIDRMRRPAVTLVWLVTTRHRRDEDNLVSTLKALCDGLVDAGVAVDDTPEHMHKAMPIIAYAKGHPKAPGLFLTVWEQDGPTPAEVRAVESLGARMEVSA